MNTPKSVIDLIAPRTCRPSCGYREIVPRVSLALLHAQADTTTFFVDFQNHDFDFIAQLNNFVRSDVLVGPVHFGHVNQTFDTLFDFHERAVVGQVGDLAEQTGALPGNDATGQSRDRRPIA